MHLFSPAKPQGNSLGTPQANSRFFQNNIYNLPLAPSTPSSLTSQQQSPLSSNPLPANPNSAPQSSTDKRLQSTPQTTVNQKTPNIIRPTGKPKPSQNSPAKSSENALENSNLSLSSLLQQQGLRLLQNYGPTLARELGTPFARNFAPQLAQRLGPALADKVTLPLIKKVGFPLAKRVGLPLAKKLGGLVLKRIGF
ncbi:hypothetical protein Desdi_1044 [Desulfitobacterium dichloroeliminans LMG P-21439]|uniref:Uncharacterized protein n=1 Tax=Desulfitobacterium dichloroeliminans (strain LMG P-21439 / DCA1) TaxID=871963 RepID=L0F7E8_DESDL|nr:hypothetical protein Desdi_1044 [Desulfitobacterium dichloroeliminans LMG P-21439]